MYTTAMMGPAVEDAVEQIISRAKQMGLLCACCWDSLTLEYAIIIEGPARDVRLFQDATPRLT